MSEIPTKPDRTFPSSALALAIDIEALGDNTDQVCQIALAVVDRHPQYALRDSYVAASYHPKVDMETIDPRSKTEFWDKNPQLLPALAAGTDQTKSKQETMKAMVNGAMTFITKWMCDSRYMVHFVSDNPLFDVGRLNELIRKYCDGRYRPLPYFGRTGQEDEAPRYRPIYDTGSMQKMLILHRSFTNRDVEWGTTERVRKMVGVGKYPVLHDHNALNDAHHIGCEYQTLLHRSRFLDVWRGRALVGGLALVVSSLFVNPTSTLASALYGGGVITCAMAIGNLI